ncbi:MAG TPA: N-acetylmuramoyl-L-alanine amidase [Acidimicrobiia bacterium]|nr:N-acetylmuramoyl-L-alanine amidase [Acidimicrobiia bacterium]
MPTGSVRPIDYDFEVIPREQWAENRPVRGLLEAEDVRFLLVHHSASLNNYGEGDVPGILQGFYDLHVGPERGWPDIAYNFLIDRFGRVWEGRNGSIEGPVIADATGGNQGFSQLVCLIGDFTNESPTEAALTSLRRTLAWMADRFSVDTSAGSSVTFSSRGSNLWPTGNQVTTPTIAGHRDMSVTACPGDALYPYVIDGLSTDVEALRRQLRTSEAEHIATTVLAPTTFPVATSNVLLESTQDSMSTTSLAGSSAATQRSNPWLRGALVTILLGLLGALLRRRSEVSSIDGQADDV